MSDIAVLVLAAGKSSRMKSIKQLAKINDEYLLDIALKKGKAIAPKNTFCVLGANSMLIKNKINTPNIQFIDNVNYESGLSSSIVSGIQYFKKKQIKLSGVFILLADQPAIEIEYLESMCKIFSEHKNQIVASNYDNFYGTPAIFPKSTFDDLELLKGDKGAKLYLNKPSQSILSPKKNTNLVDIDTVEQLKLFINS